MARLVKKTNNNYTNVSNVLARDKRLSWKARGIFLYMWSQADNWQFYVKEIASHSVDGERALTSGLKELETYGYLIRKHRIAKHGGFAGMDWILTDCPEKGSQHNPQNSINDKTAEKNGKRGQNVSDTKRTGYDSHPIQNSSLRNNNSKNYQYKEITNTSNNKDDDDTAASQADENPFDVATQAGINVNSGYHLPVFSDYINRLGKPLVNWALHQTDDNADHPNWSYLITVLKDLESHSVKTVEQAEQLSAQHKQRSKQRRGYNAPQVRETLPDWWGKDYSKSSSDSDYQVPDDSQDVMPDD